MPSQENTPQDSAPRPTTCPTASQARACRDLPPEDHAHRSRVEEEDQGGQLHSNSHHHTRRSNATRFVHSIMYSNQLACTNGLRACSYSHTCRALYMRSDAIAH